MRTFFLIAFLATWLAGCAPLNQAAQPAADPTASPAAPSYPLTDAPTPRAPTGVAQTDTPQAARPAAEGMLFLEPEESPIPVTPGPSPTLSPWRNTPPTLMLHRSSDVFDSVAFLRDFIAILQEAQFHTITYQTISQQPEITATQAGRLFIITIDDVHLSLPLDPSLLEMFSLLEEAGYPAVLGVITEGKIPNEDTASRLRALAEKGWEIASHTDTHPNLHDMEYDPNGDVRAEIRISQQKILEAIGVAPITLVLPMGAKVDQDRLIWKENITWEVGINGGLVYHADQWVHYVGRESPAENARQTLDNMMKRFNP